MASPLKPSPLSFNSPRSSPFRRPSSPGSPTVGRPSTPPGKSGPSPMTSPSKLKQSFTASEQEDQTEENELPRPFIARSQTEPPQLIRAQKESPQPKAEQSPFSISAVARNPNTHTRNSASTSQSNDLSSLPPALLHSLRESFSVLDSSSKGAITPSSVSQSLQDLGIQPIEPVTSFFPPGQPQSLNLPTYLNSLAGLLSQLSPQQELLNAFAAFDDDDSGQVEISELRDALLNTAPDKGERVLNPRDIDRAVEGFTGRRILSKYSSGISGVRGLNEGPQQKKTGDVFRYQEFVGNLTGGSTMDGTGQVIKT